MIFKIPVDQVRHYWELIKHGAVASGNVPKGKEQEFCNDLLISLLSSKSVCLIDVNEEKTHVLAMAVVRVMIDRTYGDKYLDVSGLYAFERGSDNLWDERIKMLKRLAKDWDCDYIAARTSHSRLRDLLMSQSFEPIYMEFRAAL